MKNIVLLLTFTALCATLICPWHSSAQHFVDGQMPDIFLAEHEKSQVWSVAFSPDGKTIASGSTDNTIKLWDVATSTLKATLEGHTSAVSSVAFSPDGNTIASGGSWDETIKLWNVAAGKLKTTLTLEGHDLVVNSVAFSPDGNTLVSGHGNWWDGDYEDEPEPGLCVLWDIATEKLKLTLEGHDFAVYGVAFSPDGKTIASGSQNGNLRLWDVATGTLTEDILPGSPNIFSGYVASRGGFTESDSQVVWRSTFSNVAFSPDGKTIASGSRESIPILSIANTGHSDMTKTLLTAQILITGYGNRPLIVETLEYNSLFIYTYKDVINLWDVASGTLKATLEGHTDEINSIGFSPNGTILVSGSEDRTVRLWDVAGGQLRTTLEGHTYWVYSVAFSPDGSTLASGSRDGTIRLWDMASGQLKKTLERSGLVFSVAFSPDGSTLASGSKAGTVRLWDMASGQLKKILEGHGNEVYSVSYAPSGTILASASLDGTILLWDATAAAEFSPPSQ